MQMFRYQCGQAFPIGLALIMGGLLLGLVLFNTGQLSTEKMRLANTADAAVYSGLVWQARALNFQAYTNRAMVANQVSIAQAVSMVSWSNYAQITARNINNTIGWIPPLRPFTQGAETAAEEFQTVVNGVADVVIPVLDIITATLSEAQRAVYVATFAATPDIVKAVVAKNDSRYQAANTAYSIASLGENAQDWNDLTVRYDDEDSYMRKARVVVDSRDHGFTTNRGWEFGRTYLTPMMRINLIKEGTTRLLRYEEDSEGNTASADQGEWGWTGKDTLSLHIEVYSCSWRGCGWRKNEIPIGWGEAVLNASEGNNCRVVNGWSSTDATGSCSNWMRKNSRAENLADIEKEAISVDYEGLRAYYDMRNLSEDNKDPRLMLSLEVEAVDVELRTSSGISGVGSSSNSNGLRTGLGNGMFRANDRLAANAIASISTGEVYFKRPDHEQSLILRVKGREKREYANLFNPYWQVRLRETTEDQRQRAWTIRAPGVQAITAGGS